MHPKTYEEDQHTIHTEIFKEIFINQQKEKITIDQKERKNKPETAYVDEHPYLIDWWLQVAIPLDLLEVQDQILCQ